MNTEIIINNEQSRKYLLTINNPDDYGFTRDIVTESLRSLHPDYACFAYEIAHTGTKHIHIYIFRSGAIRFSTLKHKFPPAHIDRAYGTSAQNRAYIRKEDKWAGTDKHDTIIEGSFEEFGELPTEQSERAPQMAKILDDIRAGLTVKELLERYPNLLFKTKQIEDLQNRFRAEKYANEYRNVTVIYLYGITGAGKTSYIYNHHPAREICRITTYSKDRIIYDEYTAQSVLVLEEFHSQMDMAHLLSLTDRYPLFLPARYSNKVACYTTVYLTSNLSLWEQYTEMQKYHPSVWNAFIRRIDSVIEFLSNGSTITHKKEDFYVHNIRRQTDNPFI